MILFTYPHAPYSRKVLLAAYEKGVEFDEVLIVPPFDRAAVAAMRASEGEPLATVPLLKLANGTYLTDSSIICEYLDSLTGALLVPPSREDSFEVRKLDRFAEHLLLTSVNLSWSAQKAPERRNPERVAQTRETFVTALGVLDRRLEGRKFAYGDDFTLADISAFCAIADAVGVWTDRSILGSVPHVERWHDRIALRPSWQRVLTDSEKVTPPF